MQGGSRGSRGVWGGVQEVWGGSRAGQRFGHVAATCSDFVQEVRVPPFGACRGPPITGGGKGGG